MALGSASSVRQGAVVVVFVAAVVVTLTQPRCTSHDAPVQSFVAAVQAQSQLLHTGDQLLVHPPWRSDVVNAIVNANILPAGVTVTEAFAPKHGEAWPSLVVLADGFWPLPRALSDRAQVAFHDDVTGITRPPARQRISLLRVAAAPGFDLATAKVSVTGSDGSVACPWDASRRRHICTGLPTWMTVGEDVLSIDGTEQACWWSHPKTDHTLLIDWGEVDVVGGLTLSLALTDDAADNPTGAAVNARLVVAGVEQNVSVQHQRGFHDVSVPFNGRGAVRVELTTSNDGQRHTCFRLKALKP